ncbi:MAG: HD domain-containing protein [Thermodesulfobacteriota bacterium]
MLTRDEALTLVRSKNPETHMLNHAVQSEAVMRALAGRLGRDPELWGLAGLLHDLDFPFTRHTPERHGLAAREELAGRLPEEALYAIAAHNEECTGVAAAGDFDFALRAAESVTGLVMAAALVRPTRMEGMEPKSLKKKMKDKSFAAAVDRERIKECERLGLSLDDFLALSIAAMAPIAAETGIV